MPPRGTTRTCSTPGQRATARSALALSGTTDPRRQPPSAVTSTLAPASLMRSASESGLKPPNTTECGAPILAQASMAKAASGIMGR